MHFNIVMETIYQNDEIIFNFFINRATTLPKRTSTLKSRPSVASFEVSLISRSSSFG